MKSRKLIELYGKRFTPWTNIAGFIAIIVFGILIAFSQGSQESMIDENPVEYSIVE